MSDLILLAERNTATSYGKEKGELETRSHNADQGKEPDKGR